MSENILEANRICQFPSLAADDREQVNPFSTRWTRPGAIPFDSSGDCVNQLLERFRDRGYRGAIIGRHGSGKSTLVALLAETLKAAGRDVVVARLNAKQRCLPPAVLAGLDGSTVLVIDGYEQLSIWNRLSLLARQRGQRFGLLVTSHKPTVLPVLFRTAPNLELVHRLVERLLPASADRITRDDVNRAWRRHEGNVREVFFDLYDLFEERRSDGKSGGLYGLNPGGCQRSPGGL